MNNYDAIVIGAGHNGLTNAAYLAKAGLNVVVLEKNDYIGGAAVTRELHEGWHYSNCSYVCSMMRQAIHRDLDLGRHGLILVPYLSTVNFGDGDERLIGYHDGEAAHLELKRLSSHDADAMHRLETDLTRYSQLIRKTLMRTPPEPTSFRPRDIMELLWLAKKFWALGEKEIYEYARFFTMSAADYLEDYFEHDLIKAAMASPGIIGTALGVYSPGSAYILLHHVMGDVDGSIGAWGLARGGMGAISKSIASAAQEFGAEIRTEAGVQQVLVTNGKATGVVLENGDELTRPHRRIESRCQAHIYPHHGQERPARWHLQESKELQDSWLVRQGQYRAVRATKVHARSGQQVRESWRADILRIAGDHGTGLRLLEARYLVGRSVRRIRHPIGLGPDRRTRRQTLDVQFCAVLPAETGRWSMDARKTRCFWRIGHQAKIERYSPGFRDLIVHMEVRTPHEIENEIGLTEGNIFQGELTIDQLFFNRPFPGYGQYRMPVKNMYMCGSSTHPGGGVSAVCGANAAREILKDLRKPNTVPEDDFYDE